MKIHLTSVFACTLSLTVLASAAQADTLAQCTFETSGPTLILNNSATSPTATAEAGLFAGASTATGVHLTSNADWSSPVGNGSLESFSVNEWQVSDYWQFQTNSVGYQDISISWDQTGSGTGPRDFLLQYSTDGTNFTTFSNYQMTSPAVSWSSALPVANTSYSFDLSSIVALNEATSLYFRFTMDTNISITGATVGTGGTNRIDNVVISGNVVPGPGALVLLGLAGVIGSRRRRA